MYGVDDLVDCFSAVCDTLVEEKNVISSGDMHNGELSTVYGLPFEVSINVELDFLM